MPVGVVVTDEYSEPFFAAARRGVLMIRHCNNCGHRQAANRIRCVMCQSADVVWEEASGRGKIVTWSVLRGKPAADGSPGTATILGVVALEEGPWMQVQFTGTTPEEMVGGGSVHVVFEQAEGGEPVPTFAPS